MKGFGTTRPTKGKFFSLLVTQALLLQHASAMQRQHYPVDSFLNKITPNNTNKLLESKHRQLSRKAEGNPDPCHPFTKTLTEATQGVVEWEEDVAKCSQSATWVLNPPPHHGLVLEFHKVLTTSLLTVTWNCSNRQLHEDLAKAKDAESNTTKRLFNRTNYETYDMSPLLVRGETVITMTTEKKKAVNSPLSAVNISFSAHPLRDMPQEIEDTALANPSNVMSEKGLTSSKTLYNCSTVVPPSRMPAALWCDGVMHCLGGEDEWSVDEYANYSCAHRGKVCDKIQERFMTLVPHSTYCIGIVVKHKSSKSGVAQPDLTDLKELEPFLALGIVTDETSLVTLRKLALKSGGTSSSIELRNSQGTLKLKRLQHLYRFVWQWRSQFGDHAAYRYPRVPQRRFSEGCAVLVWVPELQFQPVDCSESTFTDSVILSFRPEQNPFTKSFRKLAIHMPKPKSQINGTKFATRPCGDGSLVKVFHPCPAKGKTGAETSEALSPSGFPLFNCLYGPPVHFTVVCDGVRDCVDASDEKDCQSQLLSPEAYYTCNTIRQHFSYKFLNSDIRCDGVPHCLDGSDEENCMACSNKKILCSSLGCLPPHYSLYFNECMHTQEVTKGFNNKAAHHCSSVVSGAAVVRLDGYGMSCLSPVTSETNMEGLFYCTDGDYYIPSYMINNGVRDCYGWEDEWIPAHNVTCPGYYRCHETGNCLHPDLVCDGIVHCPNRDDELYCCMESSLDCNCPKSPHFPCCSDPVCCSCEGLACACYMTPEAAMDEIHTMGQTGMRLLHIIGPFPSGHLRNYLPYHDNIVRVGKQLALLQYLNASSCNISTVELYLLELLKILDLSFNNLNTMSRLHLYLPKLTHLYLSGNPLITQLQSFKNNMPELRHLTIQDLGLQRTETDIFRHFKQLLHLDIRNNNLQNYEATVFRDLTKLEVLYTDDYKLCCPVFHNDREIECHAPQDELSSCSDLLRSDVLRSFLWIFSFLALLGNGGVLVYRACTNRHTTVLPFRLLVTNLCASDLVMGVYMLMIGVADAMYRGSYVERERDWRTSSICKAAGFLALLSSEVSALIVCLITLDRVLTICFLFKSSIHFTRRQIGFLCVGVWILGLVLAATPLLAQLQFYGETAICLPLPITRRQFSGQAYSFAVFIVLNFILFLFIGAGQVAIFHAVRRSGRAAGRRSQRCQEDLAIARRLFLIVLTDFLCWFPIGLMGLLVYTRDVPIPGEVNVVAAIFVLPVNSALNPFLYTLNGLLETWAKKQAQKKTRKLLANLHTEIPKMSQDTVKDTALSWLKGCNKDALENAVLACLRQSKDFDIGVVEKILQTCLQERKDFDGQAREKMALNLFHASNQTDRDRILHALNLAKMNDDVASENDVTSEC